MIEFPDRSQTGSTVQYCANTCGLRVCRAYFTQELPTEPVPKVHWILARSLQIV